MHSSDEQKKGQDEFLRKWVVLELIRDGLTYDEAVKLSYESPGFPVWVDSYAICMSKADSTYAIWLMRDCFEEGFDISEYREHFSISKAVADRLLGTPHAVYELCPGQPDAAGHLADMIRRVEVANRPAGFFVDLENDLKELLVCMSNAAYRSALALSGRLLELCLRLRLCDIGVAANPDWGVGKLLSEIESHDTEYLDPSLKNIWNIVNQQRIIGVHAKERVPIPSRNQALMVVYAVMDVIDRTIALPSQAVNPSGGSGRS